MKSEIKLNLINPPKISTGFNFPGGYQWIKFSLYAHEGNFSCSFILDDKDPPFPARILNDEILHCMDVFSSFCGKKKIKTIYLRELTCNCLNKNFLDCECDLGCKKMHPEWHEQYNRLVEADRTGQELFEPMSKDQMVKDWD